MKLSKANEDTLKGLAKLLKDLKESDGSVALSEWQPNVRAIEKDLRKLRHYLKELPGPVLAINGQPPSLMLTSSEQGLDIQIGPMTSNPAAELYLEQALNELRALRNEPPVSYGTNMENPCREIDIPKVPTIDLAYESLKDIRETYVEVYGPLPEAMVSNDIDHEIKDIIRASKPDPLEQAVEANRESWGVTYAINYELAVYANPEQLAKGPNLIAVRPQEEGVFTEALYRKK